VALLHQAEDLTPDVLTRLLRERAPGVQIDAVRVQRVHQGSCTHVHLDVDYAPGCDAGLPKRLFVKTQLDTVHDLPPEMATLLSEGGSGTHLFVSETLFFQQVQPLLDVEVPRVYAAELVPGATQFVIVAEHLTDRGAEFWDPGNPLSVDRVRAVLRVLARVHATYWQSPSLLSRNLQWLQSPTAGRNADDLRGYAFTVIRAFLKAPEKALLLKAAGLDEDQLETAFWQLQELVAQPPITLLHGDPHPGNLYFLPDGAPGLLDWQLVRRGSWVHDVAYCIVAALDPADRRAHERDLLAGYLEDLRLGGVADVPEWDDAWHLYRCSPPWGFPMWAITPAEMYTPGAVEAVMARFAAAFVDLRTLEALGS
jgi:aminoglycoside phosphotransferase (APT) family kinase protein